MTKKPDEESKDELGIIEGDAPASPTAALTEREVEQADEIRKLQTQMAQMAEILGKVSKRTGVKAGFEEETGDFYGFLRTLDGDPIVSWKTCDGSYSAIGRYGEEVDEQYLTVTTKSGAEEKMHYREFDQRTKNNQVYVRICKFGQKNNLGEWRAIHKDPDHVFDVVLSTDEGATYQGEGLKVKNRFLN